MTESAELGRMVGYMSVLVGALVKGLVWSQAKKGGITAAYTICKGSKSPNDDQGLSRADKESRIMRSKIERAGQGMIDQEWEKEWEKFAAVESGIESGIRLGVFLARKLFLTGYPNGDSSDQSLRQRPFTPLDPKGNPFITKVVTTWEPQDGQPRGYPLAAIEMPIITKEVVHDDLAGIEMPMKVIERDNHLWSCVHHYCRHRPPPVQDALRAAQNALEAAIDIVKSGVNAVASPKTGGQPTADMVARPEGKKLLMIANWAPTANVVLPYRTFGDRKSGADKSGQLIYALDREEINNFWSVQAIIQSHRDHPDRGKPLPLAVFGSPGSGKSFTIEQILGEVDPKAVEQKLEFNVAQFKDLKSLQTAFHQIVDHTSKGDIPLVMFDEFDANLDGEPLGWLRYFLSPMHDGKYTSSNLVYRIGRAVFVFVGGTEPRFEDFCSRVKEDKFKAVKGPDFVSRLRGHLDIKTIDSDSEPIEKLLMFRRAILLRGALQRHCKDVINPIDDVARIDEGVVRAFLLIPTYKHGVRSIDAIVQMATISPSKRFQKASIPIPTQLGMHVDAGKFIDLMNLSP
jgi:hypothetical protein